MLANSIKKTHSIPDISFAFFVILGTSLGIIFSSGFYSNWFFIAYAIIYQTFFFFWLEKNLIDKKLRRNIFYFALRLQAQAFAKTLLFWATVFIALLSLSLSDNLLTLPDSINIETVPLLLIGILKFSIITSTSVTFWKAHTLSSKDGNWVSFVTSDFTQESISITASKALLLNRLEHYLNALNDKEIPNFTRFYFETNTQVRKPATRELHQFQLTWLFCPVMVQISLHSNGITSTEIMLSYQTKNALLRFNFFPNPVDIQSLRKYLQTYVIRPIQDELSLNEAVSKQNELRRNAIEMQLRTLQAQIEPHFLFNTLANLRQMYRTSHDAGEDMLNHLINYFRSAMEELRSESSTVAQEMDLVLHYLAIMKIRMGERLSYSFIIGDSLGDAEFPPAMLISLVENAIKHGLHNTENGKLIISAQYENDRLKVTVEDNGAGFSSVEGTGVGLSNIRQRLEGMYGNNAWLEVGALNSGGFMSSIIIPLRSPIPKHAFA